MKSVRFHPGHSPYLPSEVTVTGAATRVLLAILEHYRPGKCPTVRFLVKTLGLRSNNSVQPQLLRLRELGLITWEKGCGGSIRPTCRLAIFEDQL